MRQYMTIIEGFNAHVEESLTPKRRADLEAYLASLSPEVLPFMEKFYEDHGAAWLPFEHDPTLAIFQAYTMMSEIMKKGWASEDQAVPLRDACLQWLEDKHRIRTVSKKKDLPSRGRNMRTRY